MPRTQMTDDQQFQALNTLDYLRDLFTAARKENFTRAEILVILDLVRSDWEIFDPEVVIAQEQATAETLHTPPKSV
jgi:hypothetical protein